MFRETLSSAGKKSQFGSQGRATIRKVDHSTVIPTADMDVTKGESPKGVPIVQPYGFAYWPKSQSEEEGGGQKGGQSSGGGSSSGAGGAGVMADSKQPKGKSAIGHTNYSNATRSDPSSQGLQDPRHQLMLENPKQQNQQVASAGGGSSGGGGQQEDHGGKEGDVALYRTAEKNNIQQFHLTEKGPRLTSMKKQRFQIVEEEQQQNPSQQQQANGAGGGPSGSGSGGGQQEDGQRPYAKKGEENAKTYIEFDGTTVKIMRGSGFVEVTSDSICCYHTDKQTSMLVTKDHVHIRRMDNRIFVDDAGCWSTKAMAVKDDGYDGSS